MYVFLLNTSTSTKVLYRKYSKECIAIPAYPWFGLVASFILPCSMIYVLLLVQLATIIRIHKEHLLAQLRPPFTSGIDLAFPRTDGAEIFFCGRY